MASLGEPKWRRAKSSLIKALSGAPAYSYVVDGRFKGGYITRHHGRPDLGIHALQLEMAQSAYMNEDPPQWSSARARPMQAVLNRLAHALMNWQPDECQQNLA